METASLPAESVNRSRILAAARKRFERRGFRGSSIAEIARDAGIAVGTIYRYFENKEQILVALFDESNSQWMAEAQRVLSAPGTAQERLIRLAFASSVRFERDHLLRLVMNRDIEMILAPLCDELRGKVLRHNIELITQVIRDGIRDGQLRAVDPDKAAFILWTTADALFSQSIQPYAELLPLFISMMSDGLVARPS